MKSTLLTAVSAIVFAGCFAGCSKQQPDSEQNHKLEFSTLTGHKLFALENSAKEYNRESDVVYSDSATIIMPEYLYGLDIAALRDTVLKIAFDTIAADPREAMTAYFSKNTDNLGYTAVEVPDSVYVDDIDGFTLVQGDIYSLTSRRLTYRISNSTYLPGAAHGMINNIYVTYDLAEGDIITLFELFTPEGLNKLPDLIRTRARRLEPLIGPTNIEGLPADGNFYISLEEEIVFVYQPYEVASYAQGMIYVPFYPYQLSDYMTPRGLSFFSLDQ